jgi:hypothetical protein
MSGLSSFALGLCAWRSLTAKTWAGSNVFFEPTSPIDIKDPTICVYAGQGRAEVVGNDLLNAAGDARLRFEFFLPASVAAGGFTFDTAASQALVFALLWRQVEAVFLTDLSIWPSLWRAMVLRVHSLESARDAFASDKGQNVPVMVVELHCETVADPAVGAAPTEGFWPKLLAAMTAEGGELAALAPLLAAEIQASSTPLPDWRVAMSLLAATAGEVQAVGLGPDAATTPAVSGVAMGPAQETVTVSATPSPGP